VSRPVDEDVAAEEVALCAEEEETLALTETLVELEAGAELDEVEVKKVVLGVATAEEVEGTAEDEEAREGAPSAQTRVPFLMPARTSASEMMLPLSEYMTTVGPAT
jgi:hypothetical protein